MASRLKEALERESVLLFNDSSSSSGYHPSSVGASPFSTNTPPARRGVSLTFLRSLAACLEDEDMLHEESTTRHVISKILTPYTKKAFGPNGHLWHALPASQVGPPNFYVIHSWGGDFIDLVAQLCEQLAPADIKHRAQPWDPYPVTQQLYSSIFVWLDFLSIGHQAANVSCMNPGEQSQFDIDLLRDAIVSCPGGAVIVLDPELNILSRSWCLMEVFQVCYMLEPGKLQIAFPWPLGPDLMPFDFPSRFITAVSNVDIQRSDCFRHDDKSKIMLQAKQGLGVKRTQDILKEGLIRAARSTLRWGPLPHFFYYVSLLLQSGEISLLFTILAHIPEIQEEDSSSLEEIKEIFSTFDESRCGRLLEDAFVRVLGCAGYTIREALAVYEAISGQDGREGVGIDEFTSWWAGSQKEQVEAGKTMPKMTGEGFCKMMDGLCVFLDRKKMTLHASHLRGEVSRLKAIGPPSPLGLKMPPPPFIGDWEKFVSKLSWMMHNDDVKAASKHVFEFLVDNADALHTKVQLIPLPPSFTPNVSQSAHSSGNLIGASSVSCSGGFSRQNSAGWGRRIVRGSKMQRQKDLQLTMKTYLELLVDILRWHPDQASLMNHLARTAQEFLDLAALTSRSMDARLSQDHDSDEKSDHDSEDDANGRESSRRGSRSGRRRSKSSSRNPGEGRKEVKKTSPYKEWYSFALISDMVKMKYNDGTVNQDRIKEAGSALSQWMALSRGGGSKSHGGSPKNKDKDKDKEGAHRHRDVIGQSKVALSNLNESYMSSRVNSGALPSLSDLSREDPVDDRWNSLKSMPSVTNSPRSMGSKTHLSPMGGGGGSGLSPRSIVMGGGPGARPLVPEIPLGTSFTSPLGSFIDRAESPRKIDASPIQSPRTLMSLGTKLTMIRHVLPVTPRGGHLSSLQGDEAEGRGSSRAKAQRSHPAVPMLELSSLKPSKSLLPSIQSNCKPGPPSSEGPSSLLPHQVGFGEIYSKDNDSPDPDLPLSSRPPVTRTKSSISSGTLKGLKIKAKVSISGLEPGGSQSQGGSPRGEVDAKDKRRQLLSQLSTIMMMTAAHDSENAEY